MGYELLDQQGSSHIFQRAGVLMGLMGTHGNVLKLRPPLPFSRDNADHALEVIDACLKRHAS